MSIRSLNSSEDLEFEKQYTVSKVQPDVAEPRVVVDPSALSGLDMSEAEFDKLVSEAKIAADAEHGMPVLKAIRAYPMAVMWSIFLSMAVIMEGYDIVLMANLFAQPQFTQKYGEQLANGSYELPSRWQAALTLGPVCGEIIGLFINSFAAERFGYRKVMIVSLVAMIGFVFIVFFAVNVEMLLVGELLCGIPWGIFSVLTTTYAADVCPVTLRPVLCAYVNLCWVFGQLLGSGVLRGCLDREDEWAYRIPFALQWIWPVPIIIACYFAPESPWWLARQGKMEDAKTSLRRLKRAQTDDSVIDANEDARLAFIIHTNELERKREAGANWLSCFKGPDLRRTETSCATWLIQNTCGSAFMGYSTYFLQQAGVAVENSFNLSIGQYCMGAVGTACSWVLMSRVGRRKIYLFGLIALFVLLMAIGGAGSVKVDYVVENGVTTTTPVNSGPSWAIGAMLLIYTFVYDMTVGPVCYPLVAELPSTRLRTKTVVLARTAYNISGIINYVLMPLMLNPGSWNWKAKTGYFWAGLCFLGCLWTYFRLPEPKDRTFAELDVLFENKVSARKFATTKVDPYVQNMVMKDYEAKLNGDEKGAPVTDHVELA